MTPVPMLTTTLNDVEKAFLFPDERDRGILRVGEWLMDKLGLSPEEDQLKPRLFMYSKPREDGTGFDRAGVPIFPEGTHPYFRTPDADGSFTDYEDGAEPTIPAVVLNLPILQPPTVGDESGYSWLNVGLNEYGKPKRVRFPVKALKNLYYTVSVMRDNAIEAQQDSVAWELFWKRNQFISPAEGVFHRTRMVSGLESGYVRSQVGNLILMSGSVVIERVWLVDESLAEETAAVDTVRVDVADLSQET